MTKIIISIFLLISLVELGKASSKLSALRQSLFWSYDKLLHPGSPVQVTFGIALQNLELCPHKQV